MAYIHQVSFAIQPDRMSELKIGASLERVIGYLRIRLPNEPGHIESRAMFSLDVPDAVHLVFQSAWQNWEDLLMHRESQIFEEKVLVEFGLDIHEEDLMVHDYAEIP